MRWKITIAYDGTEFHGRQKQIGFRTVQQELEEAVSPLSPETATVSIHGSGRTDAGVHAHGQVAHFDLDRDMTPTQLRRAINGNLPSDDVRVMLAETAAPDFDARRDAVSKEYRYRIWNAEIMERFRKANKGHCN